MAQQPHQTMRVGPIMGVTDVMWAIHGRPNPPSAYIKAVFQSYIEMKFVRGKTKSDVHSKLIPLERQYPEYAMEFMQLRKQFQLPESPVLQGNPLRRAQTTHSATYPARGSNYSYAGGAGQSGTAAGRTATPQDVLSSARRHSAALGTSPNSSVRRVSHGQQQSSAARNPSTASRVVPPVNRVQPDDNDDDTPPPPYARADPEPEQTRILQEHLAAEADSAARRQSSESGPVVVRPTSIVEQSAGPDRVPSDVDLRRVWEESQLDEATRASAAAEREQRDVEEAIRLSLAEAGPSTYASYQTGSSSTNTPAPAAASSSNPTASGGEWERDVKQHFRPSPSVLPSVSPVIQPAAGPRVPTPQQSVDLLGDDDSMPATVTLPLPATSHYPFQSNNPFWSAEEQAAQVAAAQPLPTTPQTPNSNQRTASTPQTPNTQSYPTQTHLSPPNNATRQTSHGSLRDSPGSGRTYSSPSSPPVRKPLPPAPGPGGMVTSPILETFAPPSGPPPDQIAYPAPPGPPPPHLPARQETVQSGPSPANGTFIASTLAAPTFPGSGLPLQHGGEDPLEMLKDYDTVFLIDDSLSMAGERWEQAKAALIGVSEIAAHYDEDGIDVYFLNSKRVGKGLKTGADVEDLFAGLNPRGLTRIGVRMETILRDYMSRLERSTASADTGSSSHEQVKPMNLIVITDGAPSDDPESVIISIAKRLDRGDYPLSQVGIQLFQIGNDPEAREALQELDDGLAGAHGVRDMVDTIPFAGAMSADLIIKTLLGGINRRLDRRSPV